MTFALVRHRVQDFATWKRVYDEHEAARKAGGSKGARLFQDIDSPDEVILLLEWDQLKNARQFIQSDDLRKAMEKAGVADKPDVYFLEEGHSSQA